MRESEAVAYQNNFPIVSTGTSVIYSLVEFFVFDVLNTLIHKTLSSKKELSPFEFPILLITVLASYYFVYQFYQKMSSVVSSTFPNGVGSSRTLHPAYEMQHKLGTRQEISDLIQDLEKLILEQKANRTKSLFYIILLNIIFLAISATSVEIVNNNYVISGGLKFRTRLNLRPLFFVIPTFDFLPENYMSEPLKSVTLVGRSQQALHITNFVYDKWKNYRLSDQLSLFKQRIENLSCLPSNLFECVYFTPNRTAISLKVEQ